MAITTVDDIASALASATANQRINYLKIMTAAKAAGSFESTWLNPGIPGAGAAPALFNAGSGYTADKSTAGAMKYTNAVTQNYLAKAVATGTVACSLVIADRLWACSGMGFAIATYTVTTPGALPARITDSGVGCELWVEQYVAAGAASGTLTANYLNTASAAKSGVISAVVSAPVVGQMQPVPLQSGDTGISQLTSVANSATWTSGTWGMVILKRVIEIPLILANAGLTLDWASCALERIPADACLFGFILATTTAGPTILGAFDIIDK